MGYSADSACLTAVYKSIRVGTMQELFPQRRNQVEERTVAELESALQDQLARILRIQEQL